MLEIHDEVGMEPATLSELCRKREAGRTTLNELTAELSRLSSAIEKQKTFLQQLNREHLVKEREIKESRNRIFYIKEERSKIDENTYRLQREFGARQEELTRLQSEKEAQSTGIGSAQEELNEASGTITALQDEKAKLAAALEMKQEEKQTISDQISKALAKTSFKREDVEAQMQELNTLFLARMQERDAIKERIAEHRRAEKARQDNIAKLEEEKRLLDRIKTLQNERETFKAAVEKLGAEDKQLEPRLTALQAKLESRQEKFDSLAELNQRSDEQIEALAEEIAEYDEALREHAGARQECKHTFEMLAKDLAEIRTFFASRRELQKTLLLTDERIKILHALVPSTG